MSVATETRLSTPEAGHTGIHELQLNTFPNQAVIWQSEKINAYLNPLGEQLPTHEALPYEIPITSVQERLQMPTNFRHEKDISVTSISNPQTEKIEYHALTSVSDVDDQSDWKIRSYIADSPIGPWVDLGYARFEGETTTEMVATSILRQHALVQTYCFREGGKIIYGETNHTDTEGFINFKNSRTLLESIPGTKIANLYDPELTSVINEKGEEEIFATVTGVQKYVNGKAKNGRIFLARIANDFQSAEILHPIIVEQIEDAEDASALIIPPHIPTLKEGEWVPEGGKAFQIHHPEEITVKNQSSAEQLVKIKNKILFYGTCFTEGEIGNRQRGFVTIANKIDGDYTFVGLIHPSFGKGETGHGTVEIEWSHDGDISKAQLHILHQARDMGQNGEEGRWHLERTTYNLVEFMDYAIQKQEEAQASQFTANEMKPAA
jgi:hypothetical protein